MSDEFEKWAVVRERLMVRWRERYPQAAEEWDRLQVDLTNPAFQRWKGRFPEAVQEWARTSIYTEPVIRKMRLTQADWEPPEPDLD